MTPSEEDALVREHLPLAQRLARRRCPDHDQADSDAGLALLLALRGYKAAPEYPLLRWLYFKIPQALADLHRGRAGRKGCRSSRGLAEASVSRDPAAFADRPGPDPDPAALAATACYLRWLTRGLSARQRRLVLARCVEGRTTVALAREEGCVPSRVSQLVRAALAEMRLTAPTQSV